MAKKNKWQDLLDEQESGAGGDCFFLKEGKTRFKLILEDKNEDESWFTPVIRVYRGKTKSRKMVRAYVSGLEGDKRLYGIPVAQGVFKSILTMLAEGYKLWGKGGHGIVVTRTGKGLDTSYAIVPTPKPVKTPKGLLVPEDEDGEPKSLETISKELTKSDKKRDKEAKASGNDDDEDEDDDDDDDDDDEDEE